MRLILDSILGKIAQPPTIQYTIYCMIIFFLVLCSCVHITKQSNLSNPMLNGNHKFCYWIKEVVGLSSHLCKSDIVRYLELCQIMQ